MRADKIPEFKKYGDRLKEEFAIQVGIRAKQGKKYTQKDLANELGYTEQYVSQWMRGHKRIRDDIYRELSSMWCVRVDYLECIDDFRTHADMWNARQDEHDARMDSAISFLGILGYSVCNSVSFVVNRWDLFHMIWNDLRETLTDADLDRDYGGGTLRATTVEEVQKAINNLEMPLHDALTRPLNVKRKLPNIGDVIIMNGQRIGRYTIRYNVTFNSNVIITCTESEFEVLIEQIARHVEVVMDCSERLLVTNQLVQS